MVYFHLLSNLASYKKGDICDITTSVFKHLYIKEMMIGVLAGCGGTGQGSAGKTIFFSRKIRLR